MRKGTTSRPAWFCTGFCRLRRYYIHSQFLVKFLLFLGVNQQSYADDASLFLQIGGVTGLALAATLFLGAVWSLGKENYKKSILCFSSHNDLIFTE